MPDYFLFASLMTPTPNIDITHLTLFQLGYILVTGGLSMIFLFVLVLFIDCCYLLIQDFQKEIVKAAETFTAIGYKHIETGEN